MNKDFVNEIIVSAALIFLLIVLFNPFYLWMPDILEALTILAFVVITFTFTGLVWKEQVHDEREALHRYMGARLAFFAGITVLVLGIVVQGFTKLSFDPWLMLAIAAMVLAKLIARIYAQKKR